MSGFPFRNSRYERRDKHLTQKTSSRSIAFSHLKRGFNWQDKRISWARKAHSTRGSIKKFLQDIITTQRPPILPSTATHIHVSVCLSFSFANSCTIKGRTVSDHSEPLGIIQHPLIWLFHILPAFLTVFQMEAWIQNLSVFLQLKCSPESQRCLPKPQTRVILESVQTTKRLSWEHAGRNPAISNRKYFWLSGGFTPKLNFTTVTTDPDTSAQLPNSQTAVVPLLVKFPKHQEGYLRRHLSYSAIWKNMILATRVLLSTFCVRGKRGIRKSQAILFMICIDSFLD